MTKLVVIDAGHGGSDPGAVGNGLKEKDITLEISRLTCEILKNSYKIRTVQTRPLDQNISLKTRTNVANSKQADCLVSIHVNAAGSEKAEGFESFIYTTDDESSKSYALQNAVHQSCANMFKKDRGRKKANFHMVREYKGAAVLLEFGFISNKDDAAKLAEKDFIAKLADNLAAGIAKYLGVTKSVTKPKDSTYRVIVDGVQKAAYSDLENLLAEVKTQASGNKSKIELQLIK